MKTDYTNSDNIIAFITGELVAFASAVLGGVFEFGALGLKTFFIAALGGAGAMFGKWMWGKFLKKENGSNTKG